MDETPPRVRHRGIADHVSIHPTAMATPRPSVFPAAVGRLGPLLMVTSALLFGAMSVAARSLSGQLGAAQIAFVRFSIGLVMVLGVRAVRPGLVTMQRPWLLFWRGLFGGVAVLLYFVAIGRLGAGLATMLNYTFPLWAALFAALTLGERVGRRGLSGMAIATGGLVIAIGPSSLAGLVENSSRSGAGLGLAAGLVSSLFGGAATTVVRAARRTESALAVFGGFCLVGAFVCLPFAIADWRPVDGETARMLLLVGLLSFGAQLLFTWSLKYVPAGTGSLTTQLTIVSSYALAALLLGESVPSHALGGGVLVLVGVFLASTR
jgi:drug/metabolite transporter (DMT)-like permease